MGYLPAFLAWTLGTTLTYELDLLVGFVMLLNLKRLISIRVRRDDDRD